MQKIFHWLPRIFCIVAILFISMFALDAFDSRLPITKQITDFLMHLIPTYILILILFIAWKWEMIGGIIFILIGAGFMPFIFSINYNRNHFSVAQSLGIIAMINLPFILVGALFIYSHFLKRKNLA